MGKHNIIIRRSTIDSFIEVATVEVVDPKFKDNMITMFNMGGYNIVQHPEYEEEMDVVIRVEDEEAETPFN